MSAMMKAFQKAVENYNAKNEDPEYDLYIETDYGFYRLVYASGEWFSDPYYIPF